MSITKIVEIDTTHCNYCNEHLIKGKNKIHKMRRFVVCHKCYLELYDKCNDCNRAVRKENITIYETTKYCKKCFRRHFIKCKSCGKFIPRDNAWKSNDGDKFCSTCFRKDYKTCGRCGNWVLKSEFVSSRNSGSMVCPQCYEKERYDNAIRYYDFTPILHFYELEKEKSKKLKEKLFFGFEIEVENKTQKKENKEVACNINGDYLYCKEDSSIDSGFEIVSHPMTLPYFMKNNSKIMKNIYKLPDLGFTSYNNTCGMHVHLGDNMTVKHRYKMLKFFYENKMYIRKVSNRNVNKFNAWCSFDGNVSCNDNRINSKAQKSGHNYKHECLSVAKADTIEIRIFRGTLAKKSIIKNIEFCVSLYWFSKFSTDDNMKKNKFMEYIKIHKKTYPYLYKLQNKERVECA